MIRRILLPAALAPAALLLSASTGLRAQAPAPASTEAPAAAKTQETPTIPSDYLDRIKEEGLKHSQVMETAAYLTDVIGPRLTGSPNLKRANQWTKERMESWGMKNGHLEAWGPFGRGWALKRFSAQVVDPQCIPLIAFPKAWSPGTNGPVTGNVVYFDPKDEKDLESYKGKLKGAIVFMGNPRELKAPETAFGKRLTDTELLELADAPAPAAGGRRPRPVTPPPAAGANGAPTPPVDREARMAAMQATRALMMKRTQFLIAEEPAVIIDSSRSGEGGTLFGESASVLGQQPPTPAPAPGGPGQGGGPPARRVSPWDKDAPKTVPQLFCSNEHFNRVVRMVKAGEPLKATVDIEVEFYETDLMAYNTVAEIPGADLKDEVVMLGGHMDSWHTGTGATDNGAGVSVAMEAARILQTAKLQPRRTIRVALWTGEEQGLYGSRAYVKEHFGAFEGDEGMGGGGGGGANAAPRKLNKKPEFETFAGYFNLDNGTGKVRGVYLQGNEAIRPLFRQWLAPFKEMGATTLSISNTGGTDHLSFDGIGLPGFQFIQDPLDYDTRTHHSNQDVYDRLQAEDLKQAAVIMATFVYNTAMRDEKLPRKPAAGAGRPQP